MIMRKKDINEIYDKYVRINHTEAYANKYVPLPIELNNKAWKWGGKDFPRVISLLEFREYMLEYGRAFDSVLSFDSKEDPEYEYLKYKNCYDIFNYMDDAKHDLHCLELEKKDFDLVVLNQVIEHLYDPILALKNVYDHVRIGGLFYTNVPFNSIPHSTPLHFYTGVTPVGLGVMVQLAGFEILKIGQWGNKEYLRQSYECLWPDYTYSDSPGLNEIECPVITWCLAVKK